MTGKRELREVKHLGADHSDASVTWLSRVMPITFSKLSLNRSSASHIQDLSATNDCYGPCSMLTG